MTQRQKKFVEAKALLKIALEYCDTLEQKDGKELKKYPAETIKVVTDCYRRLLNSDEFIIKACGIEGVEYRVLLERMMKLVKHDEKSGKEETDNDTESNSISEESN